jgi:hypothetical protein
MIDGGSAQFPGYRRVTCEFPGDWRSALGPDKESNWLPAPDSPFVLALRICWPEQTVLDGDWTPPVVHVD